MVYQALLAQRGKAGEAQRQQQASSQSRCSRSCQVLSPASYLLGGMGISPDSSPYHIYPM